jgi:hypothetical protein
MNKISRVMTVKAEHLNYDAAISNLEKKINEVAEKLDSLNDRQITSISCISSVKENATKYPSHVLTAFILVEINKAE